jgi:hypothetical protein
VACQKTVPQCDKLIAQDTEVLQTRRRMLICSASQAGRRIACDVQLPSGTETRPLLPYGTRSFLGPRLSHPAVRATRGSRCHSGRTVGGSNPECNILFPSISLACIDLRTTNDVVKADTVMSCKCSQTTSNVAIHIQSSLVINPSGIRHFDSRPVTFCDHFSL